MPSPRTYHRYSNTSGALHRWLRVSEEGGEAPVVTTGVTDSRPHAEPDLPRLASWLNEDHLQAWWRDPSDLERVQATYLPHSIHREEPTEVFVITLGCRRVQASMHVVGAGEWSQVGRHSTG